MAERTRKGTSPERRAPTETLDGLSHHEIAVRAYEIYLARGGNEVDNWLEAEREVRRLRGGSHAGR